MIKERLENGNWVIVLDTNVLLNIYRYSPEFSEFALDCLKATRQYIELPSTVRYEYGKHCRSHFAGMEDRCENASRETERQIENAKNRILKTCDNLERLHFPDIDQLRETLEEKIDDVQSALESFFEDRATLNLIQHSWGGADQLMQLVSELDQDRRIMECLSQEEIYVWCEEGQKRYKDQIPPGFMDAKDKDGVRKYSDLFLWKETLRYAKLQEKDVVFVTDDVKEDWWISGEGGRVFHPKLIEEFVKTGREIIPLTSQDFYQNVSTEYGIAQTDAVEIALRMTEDDYCRKIEEDVFEEVSDYIVYDAGKFISKSEPNHIGSSGIDEFGIEDWSFIRAERIRRENESVIYHFIYSVTLSGTSYEYWGRDDETGDEIRSDGLDHIFSGELTVEVTREASIFYDFEGDSWYDSAKLIDGDLVECEYNDHEEDYEPGPLGNCPDCGCPLTYENDGGNGFCINCAADH